MKYKLTTVAETLGIHPRTVLRAISNEANPYWTPKFDPSVEMSDITEAFGCTSTEFRRLLNGDDQLMSPDEACIFLNMSKRTLRYRRAEGELVPTVARGSVVRYSRRHLAEREITGQSE